MRVGVITDFVPLRIFALQQAEVLIRIAANDEECCGGVFAFQDVENLRRILGIGAVVEAERQFFAGRSSQLLDAIGERNADITLVHDGVGGGIEAKRALALLRGSGNVPDIAIAFENEVVAGGHVGEARARGVVGLGGIPNRPERGVFGAHAPKRGAAHPGMLGGTQLVVGGNAVQHPDLMNVIVLVVIGIVRVERIGIVLDLGIGF